MTLEPNHREPQHPTVGAGAHDSTIPLAEMAGVEILLALLAKADGV